MSTHLPVALVTGGSRGIGAAIRGELLNSGYYVLNLSRQGAENTHSNSRDVTVDLADIAATKQVLAGLADEFEITHVVHNAGVIRAALIEDVDIADVQYLTNLHVLTNIELMQATLPAMKKANFGRFVVVGSRAMLGLETRTGYSATKAAQAAMVRTWAMELGQYGITVNTIAPGPIVTDMFTEVVPEDSEKADMIAQSLPVKRLGRPDDVSRAVMFLLSADNGFITGQCIFVCGGASLGSLSL